MVTMRDFNKGWAATVDSECAGQRMLKTAMDDQSQMFRAGCLSLTRKRRSCGHGAKLVPIAGPVWFKRSPGLSAEIAMVAWKA